MDRAPSPAQDTDLALQRCCVAVGALHESMAFNRGASGHSFALQKYSMAIRALRVGIEAGTMPPVALYLACILLTIFESIQGERDHMLVHLRKGLDIIQQSQAWKREGEDENGLLAVFSRLGFIESLYGRPRVASAPEMRLLQSTTPVLDNARDINSARIELSNIGSCFLAHLCAGNAEPVYNFPTVPGRFDLEKRLDVWLEDLYRQQQAIGWDEANKRGANILLAQYEITCIFLAAFGAPSQVIFDLHLARFTRVVQLLEDSFPVAQQTQPDIFSVDLGLIPMLFYTATACRHPQVRRKAVALLHRVPQREGVWHARTIIEVARRAIDREERDGVTTDVDLSFGIPDDRRVHGIDMEEATAIDSGKLLVFTMKSGVDDCGLHQEFYTI